MATQKTNLEIALCFSGGGYRAAAFHLGVLSYLERIKLIQNISIISTVSGGTLTGLSYAHSLKKKESFEEYYKRFYSFLHSTNLIKLSFNSVGAPSATALGYKNFITAIAGIYDKDLFSGERFGIFWDKTPIHLKELVFNSTEFRTGIDFRFQKSNSVRAKIGNGNIDISVDDAQKIRLADIAAASSCFPGGFEPLAFPHDFQWPGGAMPASLADKFPEPLPIMDGGIYDNQGIDAALLAIRRSKSNTDLFIISDTDQKKENIYPYPENKSRGRLTLHVVNILSMIFAGLSFASAFLLSYNFVSVIRASGSLIEGLVNYAFPAVVLAFLAAVIVWLRRKIKKTVLARIPKVHLASWNDIKRLTVDQVIDMAALRITSLFALSSAVFMKRIRGLIYGKVYKDKEFEKKRVSNLIYELNGEKSIAISWLKPSARLRYVAERASTMPTTLWFDNETEQRELIACGQFTICYNLLDYLLRVYGKNSRVYPAWAKERHERMKEDWEKFQDDPMGFVAR